MESHFNQPSSEVERTPTTVIENAVVAYLGRRYFWVKCKNQKATETVADTRHIADTFAKLGEACGYKGNFTDYFGFTCFRKLFIYNVICGLANGDQEMRQHFLDVHCMNSESIWLANYIDHNRMRLTTPGVLVSPGMPADIRNAIMETDTSPKAFDKEEFFIKGHEKLGFDLYKNVDDVFKRHCDKVNSLSAPLASLGFQMTCPYIGCAKVFGNSNHCNDTYQTYKDYFGSYEEGFEEGRERLKRFVSVLFQSLGWVDSLEGNNEADALPMENLEESFDRICARLRYVMKDVANFQYGTFYLSVFFTIAIGCREVKPGKHLCQLSYPIRTTAAYKHLNNPLGNTWDGTNFVGVHDLETILDRVSLRVCGRKSGDCHATVERAKCSLARKSFDSFMETLSHELAEELGIPVYYRVLIECLLCESMHSRKLHKVECHMKHGNTFDIFIRQGGVDYAGVPMMLEYGESVWKEVPVGTVTGCVFVDMELIKETDIYEK